MQTDEKNFTEWILDSGSQANICGDLSLFTTLREDKTSRLDFANGTTEHATVCGSVLLRVVNQATGELEDRLLDDVVYTPNAKVNLISMGYLQTTGNYRLAFAFDQKTAWMSKPGTILKFDMRDNIYRLRSEKVTGVMVMTMAKTAVEDKKAMELLHQRFGHLHMALLQTMADKMDFGVKFNTKDLITYQCIACLVSKAKSMIHKRLPARSTKPLEVLVMDICTMNVATASKATMFMFIVDIATRYKWGYLLEKKGQATWFILKLLRELETHHKDHKVLHLRSDQGGEFSSNELHEYCAKHGIVQQFTNAYPPQENGIAQRANRIVLLRVRALLTATHLPNML
ncbi:hypothetical protein PC129_g13284 [Phytophthora cactorum]|nr:hypothetical protein Pcac1_g9536 [Phytophthora cactorum]KAG2812327.1 hypothetical protein PC112_g15219 [Phytophthora cactorum]KAG2814381.1 hypothetical protein PC111_g14006 [Phytophthora cactorum]KAG2852152.1 hypothetical protein PC113_g15271 [Phytophthora cactorum]KAG2892539.1 hypothetical protein PC114_g16594 [Phytophthora cactorum]